MPNNTINHSDDEDVQELISRLERDEELDCTILDNGHRAFMGAVYMDAMYDPNWRPSPHLRSLVQEINAQLRAWSDRNT